MKFGSGHQRDARPARSAARCLELAPARFAAWLGVQRSQLTRWRERHGKVNEHNGRIPRHHWILESERQHPRRLQLYIVHGDMVESMTERDVECILQRACELFPDARDRLANIALG